MDPKKNYACIMNYKCNYIVNPAKSQFVDNVLYWDHIIIK